MTDEEGIRTVAKKICTRGEGTVFQRRDGKWQGAITLYSGKRRYVYAKTEEDAVGKLGEAKRDRDKDNASGRATVEQFLREWLKATEYTIKASTFIRYREMVNKHTIPTMGKVRLADLAPQHFYQLYRNKLAEGLSETTVAQLHRILHRALSQARRWGLVATNATDDVDPPRKRRIEMRTLTVDEAKRLLQAAKGDRFEALYVLALSTGLRQGELLGLRWKDIDLDNRYLQVVATLQRTRNGLALSEPKTARSRRKVILTSAAWDALCRHRARQLRERLDAGSTWEHTDLVFPNEAGKPMDAGNLVYRSCKPLLAKAGLLKIRFHDLRHTFATLLMSKDVHPKIVSVMPGHSQISITMDLYSHVLPTMQREAAVVMEDILQG